MTTTDAAAHLREMLEAEDGFLVRLRIELEWDTASFKALVDAMQGYLEATVPEEKIERWVADGFWFTETTACDWIRDNRFPKQHSAHYYQRAEMRLHLLSSWLFSGECADRRGTLEPFDG